MISTLNMAATLNTLKPALLTMGIPYKNQYQVSPPEWMIWNRYTPDGILHQQDLGIQQDGTFVDVLY